jgi:transposase
MIKQNTFPEDFKKSMVKKLLQPTGYSVLELSNKYGISKSVLYKWLRKHNSNINNIKDQENTMSAGSTKKLKCNYNTADVKFRAVIETASLTEDEIGIYCRNKGIYSKDLLEWKKQCINSFEPMPVTKNEFRNKYLNLEKDYKKLQFDLNRKEKALAEVSALLILQKKANLIWGEIKDD